MTQMDLFAHPEAAPPTTPSVESVRARVATVLETLRDAATLPWTAREAARWKLVLPQMADWLPPEERDAARREFSGLMERFERPLATG
jgi:hypothetical protein